VPGALRDELEQPVALGLLLQQLVPPGIPRELPEPVTRENRYAGTQVAERLAERIPPGVKSLKRRNTGGEGAAQGRPRDTAHLADPLQALVEPRVLAAPYSHLAEQ
jgi:hypothetical protein